MGGIFYVLGRSALSLNMRFIDRPFSVEHIQKKTVPRGRSSTEILKAVLDSAPARVREAARVCQELRSERTRIQGLPLNDARSNFQPVTVNLSTVFGDVWGIPVRFDSFKDPVSGDDLMYLLPLPVSDHVANEILKLSLSEVPSQVTRIFGNTGFGNTHGVLLALLSVLEACSHAGFSFIFEPFLAIYNPRKLIEQLVVMLHRIDGEALVEMLAPLHQDPYSYGPNHRSIAIQVLLKCKNHCRERIFKFILVVDHENVLYRRYRTPAESDFADRLTNGELADATICISSASSSSSSALISIPMGGGLHQIPLELHTSTINTALVFEKKLKLLNDEQRYSIEQWEIYFDGQDKFIEAIHEKSRGCPLETVAIVEHFSTLPVAGNEQDPWSRFHYKSLREMFASHSRTMREILSLDDWSERKHAYALLMKSLDHHIDATDEEDKAAGEWLWDNLKSITRLDAKDCYKWLQGIIDGRYLTIAENQTPRALTTRGNLVLKSLPEKTYLDNDLVEILYSNSQELDGILHRLSSKLSAVRGYMLEDRLSLIFERACGLKIKNIIKFTDSRPDDYMARLEQQNVWASFRKDFSTTSIRDDLSRLLSQHDASLSQWAFLRPLSQFFPSVDLALLLMPAGGDPPVLFPIQVTETVSSHNPSDKIFRYGLIDKSDNLVINPLMTAFNEVTEGQGRVQFIWIGSNRAEVSAAANSAKFDPDSFFNTIADWKAEFALAYTFAQPENLLSSFATIGYKSGDACRTAQTRWQAYLANKRINASSEEASSSGEPSAEKRHRRQ